MTFAAFIALALHGMAFAFIGTSLPAIQLLLDIDIRMAGIMMATLQAGFTLFTLISGVLSDLYSRERILAYGCFLVSASSFFLFLNSSLTLNLLFFSTMGAGMGCILSGSNALLAGLYPLNKRRILNIHHVFFGLGQFIGPLLMGYLLSRNNMWLRGYTLLAIALVILGFIFQFAKTSGENHKKHPMIFNQIKFILKDKIFVLVLMVIFLTVGTQLAIMLLGVTYLQQAKQFSVSSAGVALSMFAITMMLGRVICSRLSGSVLNSSIILILLGLQVIAVLVIWLGNGFLALSTLALSGLCFSGIYPTSLALTGILFPHVEGSALGFLSTMGGVGSIILCWAIGYISGMTDMQHGFSLIVIACLLSFILFLIFFTRVRSRELGVALR